MKCLFTFAAIASFLTSGAKAQTLPGSLRSYLSRNYQGWKLAGECKDGNKASVISGDFDGDGKKDFAVKFIRGKTGFLMAFLHKGSKYEPYYLHIWKDAEEARLSGLILFKKGERYEESYPWKLKVDAPADFPCESDAGGLHVYRNGKFIAY
jgi:hypothetical protein